MLLPVTLLMSLVCMATFELARVCRCYDYRSFLKLLLGKGWFLYELGYLSAVLLILAVIGAAAGTLLVETFDLPPAVGTLGLLVAIAFLAFKGTQIIEGFLSAWSFVLYAVYFVVLVMSIVKFGPEIARNLSSDATTDGWVLSGLRYGALQLSLLPAMLFATAHITERKEALVAGFLAGPIAIIPGVFFLVAMLGHYPEILQRPVPANYLLDVLGSPTLQVVFRLSL